MQVLIILGAMGNEIKGLKRKMTIEEILVGHSYRIYKGHYKEKDILLGQTGIGKGNAERCVEFLLEQYNATALISLGFSGALVENLNVGDVVLGETLFSEDDYEEKQNTVCSDGNLISMVLKSQDDTGLSQVSSVTTAKPVNAPKDKLAMGKAYGAEMVDMESYWIAKMASDSDIPFLSIRAISDTVTDTLPPFDRFLVDGQWRVKKAIIHFLTHPQETVKLFYLYRNTHRAEKNLTACVNSFITRYEDN